MDRIEATKIQITTTCAISTLLWHYRSDFSNNDRSLKALIHEFYHVAQYQRLGFKNFGDRYVTDELVFGPSLDQGFDRNAVYRYDKRSRTFDNETIEGQAQTAGDYAALRAANNPSTLAERRRLEARLKGSGIYGF
ncbi:MAG: hypothetical protein P0Y59_15065 [Candidatus Sphingomonas phytovorans]|nr:hypothetical protein [Sphingomonas sp.]WEJ98263.1 MAG: hypothetical protein P0Y59_15065 [Sphingomonas sp.]